MILCIIKVLDVSIEEAKIQQILKIMIRDFNFIGQELLFIHLQLIKLCKRLILNV